MASTRPVYLFITPSPFFPAHWKLAIPDISDPAWFKSIHVTGDAAQGFRHEFKRDCNVYTDTTRYRRVPLADVSSEYIVYEKGPGVPEQKEDATAVDTMEVIALGVPAPAASLRTASNDGSSGSHKSQGRVVIKNCQTWMREYILALIDAGILPQTSIDILDSAPKN